METTASDSSLSTIDWLPSLHEKMPKHPTYLTFQGGMRYGEQIKYGSWTFEDLDYLEVIHLTDVQFGSLACRIDKLQQFIDWIKEDPHKYVVFGGDIVDSWVLGSPGSPFDQVCQADGQIYQVVQLFAGIRHKILGYVGGNHERRTDKAFGDAGLLISMFLQIPYSVGQQKVDVNFCDHRPFKFDLWHGKGAAQTLGAQINMVERFMQMNDGHMTLVGHLHRAFIFGDTKYLRIPGSFKSRPFNRMAGMSSSFLEYCNTYAEVAALRPCDLNMIRTRLFKDGSWEAALKFNE